MSNRWLARLDERGVLAGGVVLGAIALRLLPHPPNVTPIMAMAIFGGAYLSRRFALLVPLAALIASDAFLGFHRLILFTWGSVLLAGLLGLRLRRNRTSARIAGISLASSTLFYLITNFGVWLLTDLYPRTVSGLGVCYVAALPFFRNSLLGDLAYTGIFFATYALAHRRLVTRAIRVPI